MVARVACLPANFSAGAAGTTFPTYSAAGVDAAGAGGAAFATAWPGTISGVYCANPNGLVWLYYVCGATAGGVTQVLVGEAVGATGQVLPATTETYTIALSTSGWLGPWSPSTYNQTPNAPNLTYAGAVNATALVAATAGCVVVDFTTTTTLCVRFYTTNAVFP